MSSVLFQIEVSNLGAPHYWLERLFSADTQRRRCHVPICNVTQIRSPSLSKCAYVIPISPTLPSNEKSELSFLHDDEPLQRCQPNLTSDFPIMLCIVMQPLLWFFHGKGGRAGAAHFAPREGRVGVGWGADVKTWHVP